MELIKIDTDGKITARELYEFLELTPANYAKWVQVNIINNDFYAEGTDWITHTEEEYTGRGQKAVNYSLTIDFAKHLCMLSRSDKGKQARSYFIEVEKRANKPLCMEDMMIAQLQSMKTTTRLLSCAVSEVL